MGPIGQKKKLQDNESFRVRGGEYVTPQMFTLPACFRSFSSEENTFMSMKP